ncbi:MAG: hypothetical protein Q8908_01270 [Bacteroidota bacterium]|nr:hypothetical protein [Bacteroidota bacterium]
MFLHGRQAIQKWGLFPFPSIFNVVVKGEALDYYQSKIGLRAEGGKYELKASYFGIGLISDVERLLNHSIDTVIKKLLEEIKK